MKIPEQRLCDVIDCPNTAKYRVLHVQIDWPAHGPGLPPQHMIAFEFCDDHASSFSITGRGAWTAGLGLKPGVPES